MHVGRQIHVLFVDDDETIVSACAAMLEKLGHRVSGHNESLKALRAFSEEPDEYDLAIVNHHMPDMTGLEIRRTIQAHTPRFPRDALLGPSGQPDQKNDRRCRARARDHGAYDGEEIGADRKSHAVSH